MSGGEGGGTWLCALSVGTPCMLEFSSFCIVVNILSTNMAFFLSLVLLHVLWQLANKLLAQVGCFLQKHTSPVMDKAIIVIVVPDTVNILAVCGFPSSKIKKF